MQCGVYEIVPRTLHGPAGFPDALPSQLPRNQAAVVSSGMTCKATCVGTWKQYQKRSDAYLKALGAIDDTDPFVVPH
jgi:hypothetical protein